MTTWDIAAKDIKKLFNIRKWKAGWKQFIELNKNNEEFKTFYKNLKKEIARASSENIEIFPEPDNVFNIFMSCALEDIRVVILGQDCYIKNPLIKIDGEFVRVTQAMGYSFSVPDHVAIPPSLHNIYKELDADPDVEFTIPKSGNLTRWVKEEGVFLLNCALTVESMKSNSHEHIWKPFSDLLIKYISDNTENVVFLLFGEFAKSKTKFIDKEKHCIITAGHPSPLNRTNPFVGSRVFSKTNIYLRSVDKKEINWNL